MSSKTIKKIAESYSKDPDNTNIHEMIDEDELTQFVAYENKKKPGQPIFLQDNGKVGFPSINGLKVSVGDTIKGIVRHSQENYFFVEVKQIVSAKKTQENTERA